MTYFNAYLINIRNSSIAVAVSQTLALSAKTLIKHNL